MTFAQVTLLAVWAALGRASVFARMATGLVITVIVCLCLFACLGSVVLSGVLLALWGTIQLPLWISRLFFGWRLCWPGEKTLEQGGNETQFGIRQLLAWTALVAITLGIEGEGVYSMIDGQRVDWSAGAAQITPAAALHSHHNRGAERMLSLVLQDEALHYYTRTVGFSFE